MKAILLPVLLLGVCVSVARLSFRANPSARAEERFSDALHILMNGSMALMITFWTVPLEAVVVLLYVLAAGLILWRILRDLRSRTGIDDPRRTARLAGDWYHLLALDAMAFSLWQVPPSAMSMPMGLERAVQHSWATMLLGCLFSLDAVVSATSVALFPAALLRFETAALHLGVDATGQGSANLYRGSRTALRWKLVPHLIMDFGMAVMLLGPR